MQAREARGTEITVIAPRGRWSWPDLAEVLRYRDLLWTLAHKDIRLRYRQTALGVLWVVLQPLLGALIFTVVFGVIAHLPSRGVPYPVFAFAGLMGWNIFSGTVSKISPILIANAPLLAKVYFPRLILPLATIGSTLLDLGCSLGMLLFLMLVFRVSFSSALLTLPFWTVLLLLLGMGIGLFCTALTVAYRDVQHALPVLLQLFLFASPVPYSAATVPEKFRILYTLNPVTGLLEGFRWSLLGGAPPQRTMVAYAALLSVAVFVAGLLYFRQQEKTTHRHFVEARSGVNPPKIS